jgi:uroporphyrinogen-III synthase
LSIKSILVTQPSPETEKNPYSDLAKKYKLKIDFREFIQIEGVDVKEFRKDRINIPDYSAIILTSRNAVDHFFRVCKEIRYTVPDTLKYFCISESTAYYLQKYVVFRKRKIFHGKQTFSELVDLIKKHKEENFLLPCTDIHKQEITTLLDQNNIKYNKAILYRTVASDLSDLADIKYDMLVFFSPSGIESLLMNFPKFKQDSTKIAAFGATTATAVKQAGLRLDIHAPQPMFPSMTMAIEHFIKNNKEK